MTQAEYLDGMRSWADGERFVPEKFVGGLDNVYSHFAHWQRVSELLNKGDRAIELGCGCGLSSRIYSLKTETEFVAVDKPEVVKWSSIAYATPGVEFKGQDLAGRWDFGKFDNVVCIDVIEHIGDHYNEFLQSLANAGHRETKWILTTPIGEDNNPWHLRSWPSVDDFLDDVGRYIPRERIIRV